MAAFQVSPEAFRPFEMISAGLEELRDNGLMRPDVVAERAYYPRENPTSPVIVIELVRPDQPENDYPRCRLRIRMDARARQAPPAHRQPSRSPEPLADRHATTLAFYARAPCVPFGPGGPKTVFQHGDKGQPNRTQRRSAGCHRSRFARQILQDKSSAPDPIGVHLVVCGTHSIHIANSLAKGFRHVWSPRSRQAPPVEPSAATRTSECRSADVPGLSPTIT